MKASLRILGLLGCLATAQRMSDALPDCAVDCLENGIENATNCAVDDGDCICEVDNYRNTYDVSQACVLQACGAARSLDEVLPAAARFCSEVTDGATAPPVDDSPTATQTVTSATSTESAPGETTSSSGTATESADESESSRADEESDAAVAEGPMGILGVLAMGLAVMI